MGKSDYIIQTLYNSSRVCPAEGNRIASDPKQMRFSQQVHDGQHNAGKGKPILPSLKYPTGNPYSPGVKWIWRSWSTT